MVYLPFRFCLLRDKSLGCQSQQHLTCFHFVSLYECVSSWQNVVLETPIVAGTNTEAVCFTRCLYVCLWTEFCQSESTATTVQDVAIKLLRYIVEIKMKAFFKDGPAPTHEY